MSFFSKSFIKCISTIDRGLGQGKHLSSSDNKPGTPGGAEYWEELLNYSTLFSLMQQDMPYKRFYKIAFDPFPYLLRNLVFHPLNHWH